MKSELTIKKNTPLIIFKTDVDRTTSDINLMSNFFDGYIQELCIYEQGTNQLQNINVITNENLNLINEVLKSSEVLSKDNITLVADFDSLQKDIKENLRLGKYKVATSKQVDGNMRAVIVDENNIRVKDITLKKQNNNVMNEESYDKLAIQLQIKEIFNKLTEIQDLQEYQIELDRNRDIIVPFLDARDKIIKAESIINVEERIKILKDANDDITHAMNSLYPNIGTTAKKLAECVDNPLKRVLSTLDKYMEYIIKDLQIATKYIGVQLQLLDYLGDKVTAKRTLDKYNSVLLDFFTLPVSKNKMSTADILQDNFPYNKENLNSWYIMKKNVVENLKNGNKTILDSKEIYVIMFDESENIVDEKKD